MANSTLSVATIKPNSMVVACLIVFQPILGKKSGACQNIVYKVLSIPHFKNPRFTGIFVLA